MKVSSDVLSGVRRFLTRKGFNPRRWIMYEDQEEYTYTPDHDLYLFTSQSGCSGSSQGELTAVNLMLGRHFVDLADDRDFLLELVQRSVKNDGMVPEELMEAFQEWVSKRSAQHAFDLDEYTTMGYKPWTDEDHYRYEEEA